MSTIIRITRPPTEPNGPEETLFEGDVEVNKPYQEALSILAALHNPEAE